MKKISSVFREVLEGSNYRCEQCGGEEKEEGKLRPWFIDGNRGNVSASNIVALCPGCTVHVSKLWPPGCNWENGSPSWAVNRGWFKKVTPAEMRNMEAKLRAHEKATRVQLEKDWGSGYRAGKVASKILRNGKKGRTERDRKKRR